MRRAWLLVLAIAVATLAHAERAPRVSLPIEHRVLPNGLAVVLAPDPTVSSVVVHVRYDGGAADERADERGFTSIVERLAFAGSVHVAPGAYERRIDAAGGFVGSATTADHLSLWEQVPAGALELALFLEAERMAGLADGITADGVAAARAAVTAEYERAYLDEPYALAARAVREALWPAGHPNRNDPLGDDRLDHASHARLRAFVRARIRPQHATLVIAGRFELDATRALVGRYFGWIPGGARTVHAPARVVPLRGAPARQVRDPVAKHVRAIRLPEPFTADWAALEVLAHALATAASVEVAPQRRGGELRITTAPDASAQLERVTLDDSARERYVTQLLERLEGLPFRAELLARRHAYATVPSQVAALVDEARTLTAAQLAAVAKRWFARDAQVVIEARP